MYFFRIIFPKRNSCQYRQSPESQNQARTNHSYVNYNPYFSCDDLFAHDTTCNKFFSINIGKFLNQSHEKPRQEKLMFDWSKSSLTPMNPSLEYCSAETLKDNRFAIYWTILLPSVEIFRNPSAISAAGNNSLLLLHNRLKTLNIINNIPISMFYWLAWDLVY